MALKKPLVLKSDGTGFDELQSSDYIAVGLQPTMANGEATTIVAGTPVYLTVTVDTVKKAKADASGTMPCFGLMGADTATSVTGPVYTSGALALGTTGAWDAVTGDTGGLTVGSYYYVSQATLGMLTKTKPTGSAKYCQPIGKALDTLIMNIFIQNPTLLG